MELEFDKEIDALMRKGLAGHALTGNELNAHLDADELSAFAENAMPERSRALYMAHLADCDRCRRILSNLIVLSSEGESALAAVAAPAISVGAEPWYRPLLLFPNLAYVMGGLVLVFGGLITFSLLQSSEMTGSQAISQATETQQARGPMAMDEPSFANASNASNTMANATVVDANKPVASAANANTSSNAASTGSTAVGKDLKPEQPREDDLAGISIDGTNSVNQPAAAAAPPAAAVAPKPTPADADLAMRSAGEREEHKGEKSDITELSAKKRSVNDAKLKESPRSQAGGPAKAQPGPSRDAQQTFPNMADNSFELGSRRVGGKDFQFKNGAWYDNAYRGQATTNVRRATDDYRKLDSGIRVIAESLKGVVVVVWKEKAYRIQ